MPTVFTHAVATLALPTRASGARLGAVLAACAVLPDLDVAAFWLGIPYDHPFGHRGATHSLAFAALVGCAVALAHRGAHRRRIGVLAFAATASHALLDMLTDGGLGVALFAPVSNARLFFPWRPVTVSPIGAGFFSAQGAAVLLSEFVWVWLPVLAVASVRAWRRRRAAG